MSSNNLVLHYIIVFFIGGTIIPSVKMENVCHTENCKEASRIILQGLKQDVDPCDDFYEFSCGNWASSSPILPGKKQSTRETISLKIFENRLYEILEAQDDHNASRSEKIMRKYYKNCMDVDTLNEIGVKPVNKIIEKISSDWPIMGDNVDVIDWHSVDRYYGNLTGSYSLFDIKVVPEYSKRSTNQIQITAPNFPRSDGFPIATRWVNWRGKKTPYRLFIEGVSKALLEAKNTSYSEEELDKEITNMMEFEFELNKSLQNASEGVPDDVTIIDLQEEYDEALENNFDEFNETARINWMRYINDLFEPIGISISENEPVFIPIWKYVWRLAELLKRTSNRTIVNYINWRFVASLILYTNEETRLMIFDVNNLNVTEKRFSRQQECLIECRLRHAMFHSYAKKYFPIEFKNDILEMSEKIRRQTLDDISKTDWLDDNTKVIITEKIQTIHMMVGYYDWYDNKTAVDNYFSELNPGETYFENILNYMKFERVRNLKEYGLPMTPYEWKSVTPTEFNAMYNYYFNAILFPMVYAQSPIFAMDLPKAFKYGSVGFILGHEFFHSLDSLGIGLDKNWEKVEWPENTKKKYSERVDCFKNQFNQSFFERDPTTNKTVFIPPRETLTKNENMADAAGIRAAFATYKASIINDINENMKLVGLEEYSEDQLFFISFATRFCHAGDETWWEENHGNHSTEDHSPFRLRINIPLANLEGFSETFKCSPSTPMNLQSKCIIFGSYN